MDGYISCVDCLPSALHVKQPESNSPIDIEELPVFSIASLFLIC